MLEIYDGRKEFFQWDLNQKLIISDHTITEVHFCNKTDDCSLVVEVYEADGLRLADVPNILLQDNWDIRAYAYCNGCYTKQAARFKVIARSKPSDYVYTDEELREWEKLENQIDEALEEAKAYTDSKFSESEIKGTEGLQYTHIEGGYSVTGYSGTDREIVIPNFYEGEPVIEIGEQAFLTTNINSIVIPDSVKVIRGSAFTGCSLNSVDLGKGVTRIESYAFDSTSLSKVFLPESIEFIDSSTFAYCYSITDVYCTWSEGKVANAPWAADYATIHYNCDLSPATKQDLSDLKAYADNLNNDTRIYARNTFANALRETVSGGAIRLDGISPFENTINLTAERLASVKRYGRNLFNNDVSKISTVSFLARNGDYKSYKGYAIYLPAGEYTLSIKVLSSDFSGYIYTVVNDSYGSSFIAGALRKMDGSEKNDSYILTTNNGKVENFAPLRYSLNQPSMIYLYNADAAGTIESTQALFAKLEIQLEIGKKATDYEPFIEPIEYRLEGGYNDNWEWVYDWNEPIIPLYDTTSLVATNDEAFLTAEYNKDINKAFEELYNAIISLGGNV